MRNTVASPPAADVDRDPPIAAHSHWRWACDWLALHHLCHQLRCRRAGRCRGDARACLRARARHAPESARAFVLSMMQAQERGEPFEDAFEDAAEHQDGYFCWLAGLEAGRRRER